MEVTDTRIKKILLAGILLVILLPIAQQHLHFYKSETLKGAIVPKQKVYFSGESWWNGTYQEMYNEWYNENFGFRPEMVRIHNQIAFSLYHRAKANGVVVGRENYLYELNYIKAYTGKDFVGNKNIDEMASKLRAIQDSLEKQNVTLVVCFAAGKASYYPEYIPDGFGPAADTSNYKVMSGVFAEKGINHIDYNKWFMNMKGKSPFQLYPKTGIHWSRYGSVLAIDSLISWIEQKRKIDMPGVIWERTELSDSLRSPDEDIGEAMNLMWPIKPLNNMGYPVYHFEDTAGKAKVAMMTISDSFFWSMFDVGLAPQAFSDIDFYYYFNEVYHTDGTAMTYADNETGMEDASSHQVVMLMATEANLWGFGWGFINTAFDRFVAHKMVKPNDRLVQSYEAEIRKSEEWMKSVTEKAMLKGIPVDSMIHLDAVYMAEQQSKAK